MTNEELNKWAHEKLGNCIHEEDSNRMQCGCGYQSTVKQFSKRKDDFYCPKCKDGDVYRLISYVCKHCKKPLDGVEAEVGPIPNYCSDLNLAAEIEALIPEEKYWQYLGAIQEQLNIDGYESGFVRKSRFKTVTATAEQRIRAAYQVLEGGE